MNDRTRRTVGWVVAGVGVVIALIGLLADQIGLGGEGPDEYGAKQVAALVAGIVVAVIGVVVALWPTGTRDAATSKEG